MSEEIKNIQENNNVAVENENIQPVQNSSIDWESNIDDSLKSDSSFGNIIETMKESFGKTGLKGLIKSYIHSQKQISSNGTKTYDPTEYKEEISDDFKKILSSSKDYADQFNNDIASFKKKAMELGLSPEQYKGMLDHSIGAIRNEYDSNLERIQQEEAELEKLFRGKYGEAYETEMQKNRKLWANLVDENDKEALDRMPPNIQKTVLSLLDNVSKKIGEEKFSVNVEQETPKSKEDEILDYLNKGHSLQDYINNKMK